MINNPSIGPSLKGARILVVEDEWLVSILLEELLHEFGCEVVGPATCVANAIDLASAGSIDGALLDLNVKGQVVYSVARMLADRGIPFAFVTGYTAAWISDTYRERPMLQKPVHAEKLKQILRDILNHSVH